MVSRGLIKFQIGKNGITPGIIGSLNNAFKNHKVVRVSLLKGFSRDRDEKEKVAMEISDKLKGKFKYKIIGFTIVIRKSSGMGKKQSEK